MKKLKNVTNEGYLICYQCGKQLTRQKHAINGFYDTCSICGKTTFVTKPEVFGLSFFENTEGKIFVTSDNDKLWNIWEIDDEHKETEIDKNVIVK